MVWYGGPILQICTLQHPQDPAVAAAQNTAMCYYGNTIVRVQCHLISNCYFIMFLLLRYIS